MTEPTVDAPSTITVLICDDNEEIRALLAQLIELEPGLRVVGYARDGEEVIAKARELQPDVITLDLSMQGRSGLEALPELALAAPTAKTIVVSAYAAPTIAREAMRRGAVGYVEKGTTMVEELLLMIGSAFSIAAIPP